MRKEFLKYRVWNPRNNSRVKNLSGDDKRSSNHRRPTYDKHEEFVRPFLYTRRTPIKGFIECPTENLWTAYTPAPLLDEP